MFKELHEMVKTTALTILVSDAGDGLLSVAVLPKGKEGQNPALSTPLSLTGTPEEMDAELPAVLSRYVGGRNSLAQSLETSLAVMDAAKKAVQDEATKATKKATGKAAIPAKASEEGGERNVPPAEAAATVDPVHPTKTDAPEADPGLTLFE